MTTEIDDSSKSKPAKNDAPRNIGFMMQDAREKAGYSIERAAMSTRISPAFIEALEQERFEVLPGAIFGRGFIRNLCRAYGSDPEAMIRAYDLALTQKAHPEGSPQSREKPSGNHIKVKEALAFVGEAEWKSRVRESVSNYYNKGKPYLLIAPVVVLGIYAAQAIYNRKEVAVAPAPEMTAESIAETPSAPAPAATTAQGTPAPVETPAAAPQPAKEQFTGVVRGEGSEAIEIYVKEAVNVGITRDRDRQTSESMRPGSYKLQFNEQLKLYVEDMSAVEIRFRGQSIPNRGVKGERRFMTFAVSDSAIAKSSDKTKL